MRVTANVILRNPRTGAVTVINAGEEVPAWGESSIGDHVKAEEAQPETPKRKPRGRAKAAEVETEDDN